MAKLSLSINSGSDSANSGINTGASSTKLSISKKVVDEGADSAADTASATRISQQVAPGAAPIPDQVSDNPAASITEEDLERIVQDRMAEKMAKYNAKFQEMRQQMEELEADKMEIQKKLSSTIQADTLLDEFFGSRNGASDHQKRLIDVLRESIDNASDTKLAQFVVKFAKGWAVLQHSLSRLGDFEKGMPQLDYVCSALEFLLSCVSGCFVSERRTILELVAKQCCEYFQEYIFISPEHTLNLDPEIHNVPDSGSTLIKEGVSFAVIRSDTKKTVKYADVVLA